MRRSFKLWRPLARTEPKGPVTNATGGLNPDYSVGDVVVVSDVSEMSPP